MPAFGFQWHITDRCNLRCAHCYQTSFDRAHDRSLDELCHMADLILDALPQHEVSINLTGGEPLLCPNLFGLIEHLRGKTNLEELTLITNGTRVHDELLERFLSVSKLTTLKVSLESADEHVNDEIRGEGNLARVRKNIERLLTTGKAVVLMMTLSRYNLATLDQTIQLARSSGLAGIIVERFIPLGRGLGISSQVLTAPEWVRAIEVITSATAIEITSPLELLPYKAYWIHFEGDSSCKLQGAPCNLGDESMALMPDGSVFPCRRLPITVGDVLSEPFEKIRARLEDFRAPRLRPSLTGVYGDHNVDECTGCRALAHALSDRVPGPDGEE